MAMAQMMKMPITARIFKTTTTTSAVKMAAKFQAVRKSTTRILMTQIQLIGQMVVIPPKAQSIYVPYLDKQAPAPAKCQ